MGTPQGTRADLPSSRSAGASLRPAGICASPAPVAGFGADERRCAVVAALREPPEGETFAPGC